MKALHPTLLLAIAASTVSPAFSEEAGADLTPLKQAATDFVETYNKKDARGLAAMFAENGEIVDLSGAEIATGRDEIQRRYERIFANADGSSLALEVNSIRFVGENLAIEDGTAHLTPPGDDAIAESTTYTTVLQKSRDGKWGIASTRNLGDATDPAGQLAALANRLKGDWTASSNGLRLDLAFGWDDTGNFLSGEMLATAADAPSQSTTIRIGWDKARGSLVWWTFDDKGGFSQGEWTELDRGWLIKSQGTSAEGEPVSVTQELSFQDADVFIWKARDRLIGGEKQPDGEWRVVRQAPEPAAE